MACSPAGGEAGARSQALGTLEVARRKTATRLRHVGTPLLMPQGLLCFCWGLLLLRVSSEEGLKAGPSALPKSCLSASEKRQVRVVPGVCST